MKIIFLLATRNFGGAQRSSLEMAQRLSTIHSVKIIELEGLDNDYLHAIKISGLDIEVYPYQNHSNSFFNKMKLWWKWKIWLNKEFNNTEPDVVIVKDPKTLSVLAQKRKYKIYFHVRAWYATHQITRFRRILFKYLKPNFLAVSQSTRHALFNAGVAPLENIFVVPNAINIDQKSIFSDKIVDVKNFRILHVGGFISSKGQMLSLKIAKQLSDKGIKFHMTLVGFVYKSNHSITFFKELQDYIIDNDLSSKVSVVVNEGNINRFYESHDVLIHPSYSEGLPRVIMEAMLHGLPVIANPVGGVIDLVCHGVTGFITNYNDVDNYVYYLESFAGQNNFYKLMSIDAHNFIIRGYNPDQQIKILNEIFN